jgi:hypothetical protein
MLQPRPLNPSADQAAYACAQVPMTEPPTELSLNRVHANAMPKSAVVFEKRSATRERGNLRFVILPGRPFGRE